MNPTRARHIVTLETRSSSSTAQKSMIIQREVGEDTESFRERCAASTQDPDAILRRDSRRGDRRTALSAAETGHLVMSAIHTLDATETVNRIIDFFPPHLQQQGRVMLAATLRGVVGQRLVQRAGGDGRVAVCEVLVVTGRVQDLILNPQETGRLTEVIAEGEYYGMQTFDQALLKHVMAGNLDGGDGLRDSFEFTRTDFNSCSQAQGQRASGIEQLLGSEEPAGATG